MTTKSFRHFLRDERGSYTLWSLVWFMLFLALGGLAVDVTDAYRNQTQLQVTADASALAAIMSVDKVGENPAAEANAYGQANMDSALHGDVLVDQDITLGTWESSTRTFVPGAVATVGNTAVNAVHTVTKRSVENANPVTMNFLRILALAGLDPIWNVESEAIAVGAVAACHNNGLIAGGVLSQTTSNSFFENICLHGVQGMQLRNNDFFESGVSTSTTCTDCVGPNGLDPSSNAGWDEAWALGGENDPLFPLNAYAVGDYVQALRTLPNMANYDAMVNTYGTNYTGWDHLFQADGTPPTLYTGSTLPATLTPYTIYDISCQGNSYNLPSITANNVAMIFDCRISAPSNRVFDLNDVVVAVDWQANNPSQDGIHFAADGAIGNNVCGGTGLELYTNGSSIHFAAKGGVSNVRLISGWNIDWAAQANGQVGIMAEAVNDITLRTQSAFGLCPGSGPNGPVQLTYRLVY